MAYLICKDNPEMENNFEKELDILAELVYMLSVNQ